MSQLVGWLARAHFMLDQSHSEFIKRRMAQAQEEEAAAAMDVSAA